MTASKEGRILMESEAAESTRKSKKLVVLDAHPHIMLRAKNLFGTSVWVSLDGRFCKKPHAYNISDEACRDLLWFSQRYEIEISEIAREILQSGAAEYDRKRAEVLAADHNSVMLESTGALTMAVQPREHQIQFANMATSVRRVLLADSVGLGKTIGSLTVLRAPDARPALIVVQPHLCSQWEREVARVLPDAKTTVLKGTKPHDLPKVDIVITSYNRLPHWTEVLTKQGKFKAVVADEVQELRHMGTKKRTAFVEISAKADYCLGLSATPIYNMGREIYSVLDAIRPDCLDTPESFSRSWCNYDGRVEQPEALNGYLKSQGLILRRTPEQVGRKKGELERQVVTLDADMKKLKEVDDVMRHLAMSVLSGRIKEDSISAREFDWKLRQATGVAKARPVAEFVKMIVESGEKVVVALWHREVYEIIDKELSASGIKSVWYSGSETPTQKQKSFDEFADPNGAQVFMLSLRSGAGLDGLQKVCSNIIIAELDWSPQIMDQVIGRLHREGQEHPVTAYYLTIADGSDPYLMGKNSVKRSQHTTLIDGKPSEAEILEDNEGRMTGIRDMARKYLEDRGEQPPDPEPETGLVAEVAAALRRLRIPTETEEHMQEALWAALPKMLLGCQVEREHQITKRSRVDFLVTLGDERVVVECKIEQKNRASVYDQVRRYVEEGNINALVLVAPWFGIPSFIVDETPVVVVDTTIGQV